MVTSFEASLSQLSVHRVGNKLLDEFYVLSDNPVEITDELLNKLLMQYFLSPFEKVNEVYRFIHSSDLNLNDVFIFRKAYLKTQQIFMKLASRSLSICSILPIILK